ncbi:MAG: hypothetical protein KME20_27815 [Kaiparowitsia implicata GSE-PSE-MK54-09C]|jgi:hypothetical protein|nr:hypothetical protein [Kaiparowitsia implicata GSE-PSE-MK54-09C]
MRLGRNGKRTLAQFFSGVAVACFAGLVVAPFAGGSLELGQAVLGAIATALVLAAAILISTR